MERRVVSSDAPPPWSAERLGALLRLGLTPLNQQNCADEQCRKQVLVA
jgi:hypothetical protein